MCKLFLIVNYAEQSGRVMASFLYNLLLLIEERKYKTELLKTAVSSL